jgi:hypothetical protein
MDDDDDACNVVFVAGEVAIEEDSDGDHGDKGADLGEETVLAMLCMVSLLLLLLPKAWQLPIVVAVNLSQSFSHFHDVALACMHPTYWFRGAGSPLLLPRHASPW